MYRTRFIAPAAIAILFAVFVGVAVKAELSPNGAINIPSPGATSTETEATNTPEFPGVGFGTPAVFAEASTSVRATDLLEDSRCPKGVQCIQAGTVRVSAVITENGVDYPVEIGLATTTQVNDLEVSLSEVNPEKPQRNIALDQYRFVFSVTRAQVLPPSGNSGIHGLLLVGPTCPVVREGVDCPDRPAPSVPLVITGVDGAIAARTTTKDDGTFIVLVSPGQYTISKDPNTPFPTITPFQVTVPAGDITDVVVRGDTGIR